MLHALARNWPTLVLRGVVALIFALLSFLMPGITVFVLVTLFGIYALFDGVLNLIAVFRTGIKHHWPLLVEGILGIAAGILTLIWPHITVLILISLIGFWAILTGVFEIVAAVRLWRAMGSEWLLLLSGFASVAFGLFAVAAPAAGALAIAIWIAAYAAVFGVLLIGFGLRLRAHNKRHLAAGSTPVTA
jgi:uncharacterized membrane protein HdeD (DUF308 family)